MSWCDAVLFCNRLSELEGLDPCHEQPEGLESAIAHGDDETEDELSQKIIWN